MARHVARTTASGQGAAFALGEPLIELWVGITVFAAFLQNLRTALQRHLTGRLSLNGAAYVRFCYAVPFAIAYVVILSKGFELAVPALSETYVFYVLLGSVAQVLGTVALLASFGHRNFAVGTAYAKTETVQTVLFGFVFFGEQVGGWAAVGMIVSLVGVVFLSVQGGVASLRRAGADPVIWLGIGAGAGFAFSAVCYRGAALALADTTFPMQAAVTVLGATVLQSIGMGLYIGWREQGQLAQVARAWRVAGIVGLTGMAASAAWFTAMTLERVAYVRALGQVELLFTFAVTVLVFRERVRGAEVLGATLVVGGILLLLV